MTFGPRRVTLGSHPLLIDDDQPTFWDRVEAGSWEPGTLHVLDELLGPGTVFVDIGAWVGALTLYAAALGAEVFALEADLRALDQLRRNLAANLALSGRVRVLPGALSAEDGPVSMGARRKPGDSMSSVLLAERGETWTSPGIAAGELAHQLGPRKADVVKIDIEGGEYAVLPTLAPLLEGGAALLLALHPDILRSAGHDDPVAATWHALAGLTDRACFRVEPQGTVPCSIDKIPAAPAAEWLFRAPVPMAAASGP